MTTLADLPLAPSAPIQEGPIMGMFLLHLLIVVVVIVAVCGAIKYLP
jgi:hypothetical protein